MPRHQWSAGVPHDEIRALALKLSANIGRQPVATPSLNIAWMLFDTGTESRQERDNAIGKTLSSVISKLDEGEKARAFAVIRIC